MITKILTSFFITVFFVVIFPPTDSMCEDELLAKKLIVNSKYFQMDKKANAAFEKIANQVHNILNADMPEVFVKNMVLLTAAEIALSYNINPSTMSKLPIIIDSNHIALGFMKYDTADGRNCPTLKRILLDKKVYSSDFFTFTSDWEKVRYMMGKKWVTTFNNPSNFVAFISSYSKARMESPMSSAFGKGVAESVYYRLEGLLWFLKASLAFQKSPKIIENEANAVIEQLGLTK